MSYKYKVRPLYKKLIEECICELTQIGVNFSNSICFEESDAYRRYGVCIKESNRNPGFDFTIRINKWIDETNTKDIKEVIVHELLHTVNFLDKHTGEWKRLAKLVKEELGYNIERTTSIPLNYPKDGLNTYMCPSCKKTFYMKNRSRRSYYCVNCKVKILRISR